MPQPYARGDVSGDGAVDTDDAVLAMRYYANYLIHEVFPLTEEQKAAADVNYDGYIDTGDAVYIMRFYAHCILDPSYQWTDLLG